MSVSVCIATYNGQDHIIKQLDSILDQLGENDEVIVVDDCSSDNTIFLISSLKDQRIRIYKNDINRGHVFSFDRAISLANNDFIFTSDQDDIWVKGRVDLMINELNKPGISLVTSNFEWMDEFEKFVFIPYDGVKAQNSDRYFYNIIEIFIGRTNYFGCAMAFKKTFVSIISPIPAYVESHDLWIAMASNLNRSNLHLDNITLRKRKHGNNTTSTISNRSFFSKIKSRWIFNKSLLELYRRIN
jgi:glycosyltransferase involved in cell wall biosynthesis